MERNCHANVLVTALGCTSKKEEIGSKSNPLKMLFVPTDDTEALALSAKGLADYVAKYVSQKLYKKDEGFYIKSSVPNSYIAVVEAFGSKRADFAHIDTFSYVLLKDEKKYPGEAILSILRGNNETDYKAQIITRADSDIKTLEDLNGKKFAYTDPSSPAGYILPQRLFKDKDIKPKQVVFAGRHDTVVTMIYQGQVDAGATYHSPEMNGKKRDARARVVTQFPDVFEKIRIVDFTEAIPNAPWVLRTNMFESKEKYEKVKQYITEAMLSFAKNEEGKKLLMDMYSITGLKSANDDDFSKARKIFTSYLAEKNKSEKK